MPYDHWMTDPNIIELARETMGSIDYDPASNIVAQRYVKATEYCVAPNDGIDIPEDVPGQCFVDGLSGNWHGNVWLNPPYSAGNIDAFINKALDEWHEYTLADVGIDCPVNQMMVLVNSATDTGWYHKLLNHASSMALWRGRIKFWKIQDGHAYEKWEGEKSKENGLGKIGNSPRYLNTLFYFGKRQATFHALFCRKAAIINLVRGREVTWN